MEQHHEQPQIDPETLMDQKIDNGNLEKSETLDISALVEQWKKDWLAVLSGARYIPGDPTKYMYYNYLFERKSPDIANWIFEADPIFESLHIITEDIMSYTIELKYQNNRKMIVKYVNRINTAFQLWITIINNNPSKDGMHHSANELLSMFTLTHNALRELLSAYLSENITDVNANMHLLRPTPVPQSDSTLVRPAGFIETPNTDELLRPSDDPNKSTTADDI